jgi:hypothetical protein
VTTSQKAFRMDLLSTAHVETCVGLHSHLPGNRLLACLSEKMRLSMSWSHRRKVYWRFGPQRYERILGQYSNPNRWSPWPHSWPVVDIGGETYCHWLLGITCSDRTGSTVRTGLLREIRWGSDRSEDSSIHGIFLGDIRLIGTAVCRRGVHFTTRA